MRPRPGAQPALAVRACARPLTAIAIRSFSLEPVFASQPPLDMRARVGVNRARKRMSADHGSPPLPPEPKTPTWLTALGAVLFFSAAVWWLATKPSVPSADAAPADAGVAIDASSVPPG